LNRHRAEHFSIQYLQDIRYVDEIRSDHNKSLVFVSKLLLVSNQVNKEILVLKEFLENRNAFVGIESSMRTICLLDATGSMGGCIKNAKQSISKMFERAYDILQSEGISSSFEMQFAAYRNYNAPPESLLQYSPWSSRPRELQQFLTSVKSQYGLGNEAIEIALWHVNQQHAIEPVGQVVIIGDMPPNTPAEVLKHRQLRSWDQTPFATPTFFQDQMAQIVRNEIKVHAFYVQSDAKSAFKAMSRATGGEPSSLNVNSPSAGDELTDLVTRHILMQQGGKSKGATLVAAYDAKYGRRGHVADSMIE
jgi:hypothetical protein